MKGKPNKEKDIISKSKIIAILLINIIIIQLLFPLKEVFSADENIVTISTKEELFEFANNVNTGKNNYKGKTVKLLKDINLNNESWTPIGTSLEEENKIFKGTFDGQNHTISGININTNVQMVGLFGIVKGTIKNLKIDNGTIISTRNGEESSMVGGIVGELTQRNTDEQYLENCHNLGVNIQATNPQAVGGIVGWVHMDLVGNKNHVINCSNKANINCSNDNINGLIGLGGISGHTSYSEIVKSYNTGNLTATLTNSQKSNGIGGISGSTNNSKIEYCYNTGTLRITGTNENTIYRALGGITAYIENNSNNGIDISNCYNAGTLTAEDTSQAITYKGGIVGVSGNSDNSALGGTTSNCYYLDSTAENACGKTEKGSISATKKTSSEMKTDSFVNSLNNGEEVFVKDESNQNGGYPIIQVAQEIQFQDSNLYNAIVDILADKIIEKNDQNKTIKIEKSDIESITTLNLGEKQITNLSGIENFTNLQDLQVYTNNISDISVLNGNTSIQTINLNDNKLTDEDMKIFSTMTNLKRLGIAKNESITKIGDISKLTNLIELNAINNQIKDLSGIEKLTKLQEIYLSGNEIKDISGIPNASTIEIKDQKIETTVVGTKKDELELNLPNIIKEALNPDSKYYSNEGVEIKNAELNETKDKITINPYTIAKSGAIIQVKSGILQNTYLYLYGVSVEIEMDLTSEENIEAYELDLDLNSDEQINEQDAEVIKKWYENETLTLEEQQKVSKMDLNLDGSINERDYNRLKNYINKTSEVLITSIIEDETPINTNVVTEIITNNPELDINEMHIFTQNDEYEYTFNDTEGEEQTILVAVNFIDKEVPEYEIKYSTQEPINGDVTVTITANEELADIFLNEDVETEWRLLEDKRTIVKTFTENANETIEICDLAQNTTEVNIVIENIMKGDIMPAELTLTKENEEEYEMGIWVNENVKAKINPESLYETFTAEFSIDGEGNYTDEQTITEDGKHNLIITTKDPAGNTATQEYEVLIDKTEPETGKLLMKEENATGNELQNNAITSSNIYINVEEGTDNLSGHNKTVYTINDGEECTNSQILRNEGTYNIKVKTYDNAGNESEETYSVTIERDAPQATVNYQKNSDGTVTVKITSNKQLQELEGWNLSSDEYSLEKTYNINKQETIEIMDKLGNKTTVYINVEGIEKIDYIVEVDYSTKQLTNEDVIVTISSNKEMKQINGFTISQDRLTQTKEYSQNTEEKITVGSLEGEEQTVNIIITNIDKEKPELEIEYSTTSPTTGNVTVTITTNEKVEAVNGWNQTATQNGNILMKEYTANTEENITIKDLAGNTSIAEISINNINKDELTLQTSYSTLNPTNENITVTIKSNLELKQKEGWNLAEDKKILTKEYSKNTQEKIKLESIYGQTKEVTINVNNIDKVAPNIEIKYSTLNYTQEPVTVTITANEEIQAINGWTRSSDRKTLTKEYSKNTEEEITIKDLAGNERNAKVTINNIVEKIECEYELTQDGYILKIEPNTSKEEFLRKLGYSAQIENTDIVKTGMKAQINGKTYTLVVAGDINRDGQVDIQDLSKLVLHLSGYEDRILKGEELKAVDINLDGETDIRDLSKMSIDLAQ